MSWLPPVSLNGTDYSRVRDLLEHARKETKPVAHRKAPCRRVGLQESLRQATVEHATVGGYRASIAARVAN